MTYAKVKVTGRNASTELNFLVDTGSLFTWAPGEVLRKIGVEVVGVRKFRTMEGREITRQVGGGRS